MTPLRSACVALLASALGCSASAPESAHYCPDQKQESLYNASAIESYLGLSEAEQRALVAIVDGNDLESSCSGAFVAPTWVLTAAHCDELSDGVVVVPKSARLPSARLPVVRRRLHPDADIALFEVDFSAATFGDEHAAPEAMALDASSLDIVPLTVPLRELTNLAAGVSVELTGYGLTELGESGSLGFLVEQVIEANQSTVTVAGFGRSGACEGDSGAPLLMRDEGAPIVAGVLWGGSFTCLHEDHYLRTDASGLGSWIRGVVGAPPDNSDAPRGCGGISTRGRCLYGSALWCDGLTLASESCGDDRVCGWSSTESGFRCVAPEAPCAGVDDIGTCREGRVVHCAGGQTETTACDSCSICRVRGGTGTPYCTGLAD